MPLMNVRNLILGHGGHPLLEGAEFQIEPGERICLLGRNGVGKSSLLKLLAGFLEPDSGTIDCQQHIKIAYLQQEVQQNFSGSVESIVADGLGALGDQLNQYERLNQQLQVENHQPGLLAQLAEIQEKIDRQDGWRYKQQIEKVISQVGLEPQAEAANLSGGLRRRVLLAKALVTYPDILLLDEPTNHLDIESIAWLENFLLNYKKTLFFVSHDRAFMQQLATRILEIDNGKLTSWPGNYELYIKRKTAALEAEERQDALFDKRLAQEEIWIRQGIKARRTRNEGRVRALKKMREQRKNRRCRPGKAAIDLQEFAASGKIVFEVERVNYAYEEKTILKDFSTAIVRGDKIGIIGPNGSGKSTLLKLLLGDLTPDTGTVKRGTNISLAYFDQYRGQLDESKTAQENVGEGSDTITFNGKPRHVLSYLQDFLFSPERARAPIKALSGGERNRLLLAKLFTRSSNVLIMDEPTNDLDIETLELLEEQLLSYQGTLLLVSHDRAFLNNIVTSTLVFEGDGKIGEYVGGYDDWKRQSNIPIEPDKKIVSPAAKSTAVKPKKQNKLSYNEQRELKQLPDQINALEEEQATLQQKMSQPDYYQQSSEHIAQEQKRLKELDALLVAAYERWESLEEKNSK